jgi:hypothetical protein
MHLALRIGYALTVGLALGCEDPVAACGPCRSDEYCVEFGSDIAGQRNTFECVALPQDCEDDPSCECLETVEDEDSNLESSLMYCLEQGSCGLASGVPHVLCPGG